MSAPYTRPDLPELEARVRAGWRDAAVALAEIHARRLWMGTGAQSFAAYCRKAFGWSATWTYQLLAAAGAPEARSVRQAVQVVRSRGQRFRQGRRPGPPPGVELRRAPEPVEKPELVTLRPADVALGLVLQGGPEWAREVAHAIIRRVGA